MAVDGITKNSSPISVPTQNQTAKSSESSAVEEADDGATKIYEIDALSEEKAQNALSRVKTGALESANSAISSLNEARDTNNAALKLDRQISRKAEKLTELLEKDKGGKQVQKLQEEIGGLLEERSKISAKAEEFDRSGKRAQSISFGSQKNTVINVAELKIKDYEKPDLTSPEGLQKLKQAADQNITKGQETKSALREERGKVAEFVSEVKDVSEKISGHVSLGFEEAAKLASDISSRITDAGSVDIEKALGGQLGLQARGQTSQNLVQQVLNSLLTN